MKTLYYDKMTNLRNINILHRLSTLAMRAILVCLLVLCGVGKIWGQTTVLYERGTTTAWSDTDLTDWTTQWNTLSINGGLYSKVKNAGWLSTKSITTTNNSIVTFTAVLQGGQAPGRSGSYDYINVGGVELRLNGQDQVASVAVNGNATNLTGFNRGGTCTITATINQTTGNVSYTVSGASTGSGSGVVSSPVTSAVFGHNRAGSEGYEVITILKSISISEEPQAVIPANYTIRYLFNGVPIKDDYVGTGVVGNTVEIPHDAVWYNDAKFIYVSDDAQPLIDGENIITVNYREAAIYNYFVNSSLGSTIVSGSNFEGEAVNYKYPQFELSGTTLYECAKQGSNPWYGKSFVLTSNNQTETLTYNFSINDVVYYSEAEDIEGATVQTGSNADIRCSGGKGASFASDTRITTLTPGKYKVWGQIWGNKGTRFSVKASDTEVWSLTTTGSLTSILSEEFILSENTDVKIAVAGDGGKMLDNIYIVRTGDDVTYAQQFELDKAAHAALQKIADLDADGQTAYHNAVDAITIPTDQASYDEAIAALEAAYIIGVKAQTTPGADMTGAVKNADCAAIDGWSISPSTPTNGEFHVNTWSTEADGTDMTKPFIEYWVKKENNPLSNATISHEQITGLRAGYYRVSGLVRIYSETGNANLTGATLNVNGESVDMCVVGKPVTFNTLKGVYGNFSKVVYVDGSGNLDFNIAINGANFNWIAMKNFTLKYVGQELIEDVTFDFTTWGTMPTDLTATKNTRVNNVDVYNVAYPYPLAGYMALQNGNVSVDNGVFRNHGSGLRHMSLYGLKAGDVVTFNVDVASKLTFYSVADANKQVSGDGHTVTITMAADGNLGFSVGRGDGTHAGETAQIYSITLPGKDTPHIITQPVGGQFRSGTPATLSVVAAGADSYQWYVSDTESNHGGTAISGATSSTYDVPTFVTSDKYYYCLVKNNTTGTIVATDVAHVKVANVFWKDIELDLRTDGIMTTGGVDNYVVVPESGVAEIIKNEKPGYYNAIISADRYNDTQHGYIKLKMTVPVAAGFYKITIGNCKYPEGEGGTQYTVTSGTEALSDASFSRHTQESSTSVNVTPVPDVNLQFSNNMGQTLSNGALIWGNPDMVSTAFTDLSSYTKMKLYGEGTVRLFFNRATDAGIDYQEIQTTLTQQGTEIDLTTLNKNFAHLNAVKAATGAGESNLWNIELMPKESTVDLNINAGANCYSSSNVAGTTSTTLFSVSNDTRLEIKTENGYTPYIKIEKVERPTEATVIFDLGGEAGVEGTLPANQTFALTPGTYTIPVNQTLFKEGYTLVGWMTNDEIFYIGDQYIHDGKSYEVRFTPVFRENTKGLKDIKEPLTVKWDLANNGTTPVWNEVKSIVWYVNQVVIDGEKIDFPVKIDPSSGKLHNYGRDANGGAQVNPSTKFTVPSIYGAVPSYGAYYKDGEKYKNELITNHATSTVADGHTYTQSGSSKPYAITYPAITSDAKNIDFVMGSDYGGYLYYVQMVYPVSSKDPVITAVPKSKVKTTVTITAGDGATIYYTTDGTEPVMGSSTVYSTPFDITEEQTIKAIALEAGKSPSHIVTAVAKIMSGTNVAYIYNSTYVTYCGIEKDPLYLALKEHTDYNVVPFDINGKNADNINEIDIYDAVIVTEAMSGGNANTDTTFEAALKNKVDVIPMISMKTFFYGTFDKVERWAWGNTFNPVAKDGTTNGVSNIRVADAGKQRLKLFEGILFNGMEAPLFNSLGTSNRIQGVTLTDPTVVAESSVLATVDNGTTEGAYTAVFSRGNKFLGINYSCDAIQDINGNGIRLVENALDILIKNTGWETTTSDGPINKVTYTTASGNVDLTTEQIGELSDGLTVIIPETIPKGITVSVANGTAPSVTYSEPAGTFQWCEKEYQIQFSTTSLVSTTPANGATGVGVKGTMSFTFSEAMKNTDIPQIIFNGVRLNGKISSDNKTFSYNYGGLQYNTQYTLSVPARTFINAVGVPYSRPISITFTTSATPSVAKVLFNFVVDSNLDAATKTALTTAGIAHGTIDQAIVAANGASTSAENRFYIFVPDGQYQLTGLNDDQTKRDNHMTTMKKSYVSIIGQSMDKTIIWNKPTAEGIDKTATLDVDGQDIYLQDLTLENRYGGQNELTIPAGAAGRAVALEESGSTMRIITKNVKLNSNQDTYYTWKGNYGYHEGSVITGTVDFICGAGNYWFEGVTLQLNNRDGNVITAPATSSDQWGYVFNNSIIDRAAGATKVVNKGFNLGRDWQNSPAATYLNTTMKVLPTDAGWTNMSTTALPARFHEYGSKDANGNLLDLSKRSLNALVGGQTGKDDPVLTPEQAAEYTIENVFAGIQDADGSVYDPRVYTIQVAAPVAQKSAIDAMTWTDNGDALCFFIFRDGKFVGISQSNTFTFTEEGSYTVRAANARGGLGEESNAIVYSNKIPTSWDFTKVVNAGASDTYWIIGDDYGSVKYVDGVTNVPEGAYLRLNEYSYLQEAFGLKFKINSTSDDQLRCYVNAKGFIAPGNDNVTIYIPTTGNGQVIRYVTANVTTDPETGDEIVTYTNNYVKYVNTEIDAARTDFGTTITEEEVKGYYALQLTRDTYLAGISLIANTTLSTPIISNNGYDRATGKWNINITAVDDDAVVYYKIGDGAEVNSGKQSVDVPIPGGESVIAWANNASGIFTPSATTTLTTEVVTPTLSIELEHEGLMALTTAHSEAATMRITVKGQYLGGESSLTLPDIAGVSIYPMTFSPANDGSLNQNFWLTWKNTAGVLTLTTKQITFGVGTTQQSADIKFKRDVAYNSALAPVTVNSATKWDWTYAPKDTDPQTNGAGISLTATTTPTRYEYVTMGQLQEKSTMFDGASKEGQYAKTTVQTDPTIFHGDALQWEGQRVYRYEEGKDHFGQGDYLAFNAGCDGLLSVSFSSTGNIDRGLYLTNGTNVKTKVSNAPTTTVVTVSDIPIKAGKVILEGFLVDQSTDCTPQYLRFYEMTFTAQAQAPEIAEAESNGSDEGVAGTHYVTLTTDDANDEIIYTLDGSEPTRENGILYRGKFIYAYNAEIKAKTMTTGKLPSVTSTMAAKNYTQHKLTVLTPDRHGAVTLTPASPDSNYIAGTTVTLTATSRTGYVFKDFSTSENDQTSLSSTSPYSYKLDADATIYAFFQKGKEGTVKFSLDHVYLTNQDGTTNYTDVHETAQEQIAEKFVYESPIATVTSTALSIPNYYILYWKDHTLLRWEDESHNQYSVGSSREYETEGANITLYPVFKANGKNNAFDSRTEPATVTWDFRTAYGAQPGQVPSGLNGNLHMATQATVAYTDNGGHTIHEAIDVPLTFTTKDGGFVNNTEQDEWVTFGEGLVFDVPSGAGAKFQLATYGKLTDTTIDGKLATSYEDAIDDNGIHYYIYRFTTDNTASSVPLVIGSDRSYYKFLTAELPSGDKVVLTATVNNSGMGNLSLSAGNTSLGNNRYSYNRGTNVTVTANRERYYELDHWEIISGKMLARVDNSAIEVNGITYTPGTTIDGKPTLSFQLDDYATVHAVFKEKKSYYINFTAGGESTMAYGLPLYQQHVEEGEAFVMPDHNQQLYVEGHTLKYYVDEDGHRYDFGNSYTNGLGGVPAKDLYLTPVFEANTKTLADITTATTLKFPLGGDGAPEISYRNSSGIIVEQITIGGEKIDMPCYITTASNSEMADNVSNKAYCHVEGNAKFAVQTTKGCVITLKSTGTGISKVIIAGATSTSNGTNASKYTAGNTVNVTYNGTAVSQELNMNGSKLNLTELDVTYQPFAEAKPVLTAMRVGGTTLSDSQLSQLRSGTLTINHAMTQANYSDDLPSLSNAVITNSGTATITQATAENTTATVQVKTASGLVVGTYKINFNVTSTALPQCTLAKVGDTTVPTDGSHGAVGVGTNGVIRLTFDHKMADTEVTAINSQVMKAASDRTLAFTYWNLEENTSYTFQVPGTTFKDVFGQSIAQNNIVISFTTGSKVNVTKRLFNYVADDKLSDATKQRLSDRGIPHGPLSVEPAQMSGANSNGAIAKADDAFGAIHNAATSETERFYVFVPDGEYQMAGNVYRTVTTKDTKEKTQQTFTDVYNGDTWINKDYVSIVGQSQDGTIITNTPKHFFGISYTSTLEVKAKKQSCYFQDFTLDNRWSKYQVDRGDANPGDQAVAFYDRGIKTIMKNVTMKGYQDTYASASNTSGSSTAPGCFKTWRYYEDCENWGTVDFFCGAGDDWWERPTIVLRKRTTDNNIVAPRHFYDLTESYTGADKGFKEEWGYVYNNALIKAESPEAYSAQNGKFTIGRTWQNSPALTFLSPRYDIMPADRGYNTMSQGLVCRLHEYNSLDANTGLPIDLTKRTIRSATPAAGSDDCVMTDLQAKPYTLRNVLGGSDAYDPTIYTEQVDMTDKKLYVEPNRISWDAQEKALCYFVFRLESNGKYELYDITTDEYLPMTTVNVKNQFVVRAANSRGGLGPQSLPVEYYETTFYDLAVNEMSNLTPEDREKFSGHSWSTICLPHGAIVPEGSYDTETATVNTDNDIRVYAVTEVNELDVHLKKVQHIDAHVGYVVFAKPGATYRFLASEKPSEHVSHLRGYAPDYIIVKNKDGYDEERPSTEPLDRQQANVNCYTLAYKPAHGIGFYKYNNKTLAPYRAWLDADLVDNNTNAEADTNPQNVRICFIFDEEPWGDPVAVDAIDNNSFDEQRIYNLQGIRILNARQLQRGHIYIINGKKVIY